MISEVFVEGRRFALHPSRSLGKGGEADVYDLGHGRAVKVFKWPDHPDYDGSPEQQRAAEDRLAVHQEKLRAFPSGLPPEVIAPDALATNRSRRTVLGYTMKRVDGAEPLLRYADPVYRRMSAPDALNAHVIGLFRDLHRIVSALHDANVVVGDFNDLNVLVNRTGHPLIIDADSFQFGVFACAVFTERFVDPLLSDPSSTAPRLSKPYTPSADWYAFNLLLFQSLLFVGPYGGVFRPRDPTKRVPHGQRPLHRITVFHPEVLYPKPARPYRALPDDLLHHFHRVFERDERAPFPLTLLDTLAFVKCPHCGAEHARTVCPLCAPHPIIARRWSVHCEDIFKTSALIVHAAVDRGTGTLRVVSFADGIFRREDGTTILHGDLEPGLVFRTLGRQTLVGRDGELMTIEAGAATVRRSIDRAGGRPTFATDGHHCFRLFGGQLLRDAPSPWDTHAAEVVGHVLENQTHLWAGPAFGLGFYRAGNLSRAFLFDTTRRGINDALFVPHIAGEIVDATAALDDEKAWLFLTLNHHGRLRNLSFTYDRTGTFLASSEAEPGDGGWLGTIHGKCATRGLLFAATDAGIERVEIHNQTSIKTNAFPDTETFVDSTCRLLVGHQGLAVVRQHDVLELQMKPRLRTQENKHP